MDWFLYDNGLRHEGANKINKSRYMFDLVKQNFVSILLELSSIWKHIDVLRVLGTSDIVKNRFPWYLGPFLTSCLNR